MSAQIDRRWHPPYFSDGSHGGLRSQRGSFSPRRQEVASRGEIRERMPDLAPDLRSRIGIPVAAKKRAVNRSRSTAPGLVIVG